MSIFSADQALRHVLHQFVFFRLKEDLAKEWQALQEKEKNEEINIAFVYWDGSSHRKDIKMKKGNTISQFLARALEVHCHAIR